MFNNVQEQLAAANINNLDYGILEGTEFSGLKS